MLKFSALFSSLESAALHYLSGKSAGYERSKLAE